MIQTGIFGIKMDSSKTRTVRESAPLLNLGKTETWITDLLEDGAALVPLMPVEGDDYGVFCAELAEAIYHCPYFKIPGRVPGTLGDERLPYYMHARIIWSLLRTLAEDHWMDLLPAVGRAKCCSVPDCMVKYTKGQRVATTAWKRDVRPKNFGSDDDIMIRGFFVVGGTRRFTYQRHSHDKSGFRGGDASTPSSSQEVTLDVPPGYAVFYFGSLLTKTDGFIPAEDSLSVAFAGLFTDRDETWNPNLFKEAKKLAPFTGPYGEKYRIYDPSFLNIWTVGTVEAIQSTMRLASASVSWNNRLSKDVLNPVPVPISSLAMTDEAEIYYPSYEDSDLEIFLPCGEDENEL